MKKERILYFDVMKFLAVIFVFTCHFTRSLEYWGINFDFKVLPDSLLSLYLGSYGVTLFFIISGASLMYVYDEKLELKTYFKKRFLGIYPLFWFLFILSFLLNFYVNRGYDHSIPKWKLLYSLIGIDGTMSWITPTFYQVGEWFLGVIIALYALFPLLRICVRKFPVISYLGFLAVALVIGFLYKGTFPVECIVLTRIPEFMFGMLFVKYIKKVRLLHLIPSAACLVLFAIAYDIGEWNLLVRTYLVGISTFLVLAYLFSSVKNPVITGISQFISNYNYPIFLIHHVLQITFLRHFVGMSYHATDVLILYVSCGALTIVLSIAANKVNKQFILPLFQKILKRSKPVSAETSISQP